VPGRGAEHPRAFALAPGGDSGAVPTTIAIRAGAEWPLQTDAGTQKEDTNLSLCWIYFNGAAPNAICDGRQHLFNASGPAIIKPPSKARAEWVEGLAAVAIERPALKGLRSTNKARWLKPEIGVTARYLTAKGALRHATVKALLDTKSGCARGCPGDSP
jgi:hypothetical protein